MEQVNDLRKKRAVILGGSSGIGLAVAEQAASQGANIVIASSNPEKFCTGQTLVVDGGTVLV